MRFQTVLALTFFLPCGLFSQDQQQAPHYTIKGSVVNSLTGEPIRKAAVSLQGPEQRVGFTGPDGQFQMENVLAGEYRAFAQRPGFQYPRQQSAGPVWGEFGNPVSVGPDTPDVTLKLMPLGAIAGRVTDKDGRPIPSIQVQCLQEIIQSGRKRMQPINGTSTDADGHFEIADLAPGEFLIRTNGAMVYPGAAADDDYTRLVYPQEYFPNSLSQASAQPLDVKAGGTTEVDLTLTAIRGTRVYFNATPVQQWATAMLVDENGDQVVTPLERRGRKGYLLPAVPPGSWKLVVEAHRRDATFYGEVLVEGGGTDITNLTVPMAALPDIPVVVTGGQPPPNQGDAPPPLPVLVQLTPAGNGDTGLLQGTTRRQDGTLAVSRVSPGSYRVTVRVMGQDCVDSVTSGGTDLARGDLVVTQGGTPAPISIGLRSDCASLQIQINQEQSQTAFVIVAPESRLSEPLMFQAQNGTMMGNLSPGEYRVYAFTDVDGLEYANPEVLKKYNGVKVSLDANARGSVTVDVNSTGGSE